MILSHATHVGRRDNNEDSCLVAPELGVFAVCDGMGGHLSGEVASYLAVQAIRTTFQAMVGRHPEVALRAAISNANGDVIGKGRDPAHYGLGTTVVALAVELDGAAPYGVIGWVGDSRCYRLRGRRLEQLTQDHSVVNHLIATGQLTAEDAWAHPERGNIYRSLGAGHGEAGEYRIVDLRPGDVFLLCSDGLTDTLSDRLISAVLEEGGGAHDLVNITTRLNREHQDNVSVIVLRL